MRCDECRCFFLCSYSYIIYIHRYIRVDEFRLFFILRETIFNQCLVGNVKVFCVDMNKLSVLCCLIRLEHSTKSTVKRRCFVRVLWDGGDRCYVQVFFLGNSLHNYIQRSV